MAQLTFQLAPQMLARAEVACAALHGYDPLIPNPADPNGPKIANPQSVTEFFVAHIKQTVKDDTRRYEMLAASETASALLGDRHTARVAAMNAITDIVIT